MTDGEPRQNPWEFLEQAGNEEPDSAETAAADEKPAESLEVAAQPEATSDDGVIAAGEAGGSGEDVPVAVAPQQVTPGEAVAEDESGGGMEANLNPAPTGESDPQSTEDRNDDDAAAAPADVAVESGPGAEADLETTTPVQAVDEAPASLPDSEGNPAATMESLASEVAVRAAEAADAALEPATQSDVETDEDPDAGADQDSTEEVVEITEDEDWSARYTAQYGEEEVRELASDLEHQVCSTAGGLLLLALPLFPAFQIANSWAPSLRAYNTIMGYAIIVVFWFTCVWGFFRLTVLFASLGPSYSQWFSRSMVAAALINLIWMGKWIHDHASYGW